MRRNTLQYESWLVVCHECGRVCKGRIDERIGVERITHHKTRDRYGRCHGSGQVVEIEAKPGAKSGQYEEL